MLVPYADYTYYTNEYKGNQLSEEEFNAQILKATRYVNYFTFNRIVDITQLDTDTQSAIRDCVCDLAENLHLQLTTGDLVSNKKMEMVDGYTVSYAVEGKDGEIGTVTLRRKLYSVAQIYLVETGLLYRGL